ncbi:MAG: redoxin domain-containing protein [Chitinophagales bacterium]|nr:redoxin domain-containing protein [Chitinophagales bacterium]MDW8427336.1 redoxin domain-containing protein [Chitinophagales bacterium]
MKKYPLLFAFLLLWAFSFSGCRKETSDVRTYHDFALRTIDGDTFDFAQLKSYRASVVLFLQPECPFCHTYSRTFREVDSILRQHHIRLLGVVAGKNFPIAEIKEYRDRYRFAFPILLDPDFKLTRWIKATITPQVFLMDQQGKKLYHGLLDNWAYEIGKVRARATEFYLLEAVHAYLNNQPQPRDSTQALGCYIE